MNNLSKAIFIQRYLRPLLYLVAGFAILFAIWQLASVMTNNDLPSPFKTMSVFFEMWSNPFYDAGPNDKGIGVQLAFSLWRVFLGFSIGTIIAIPLGFIIGSNKIILNILNPVIQILR